MGQKQGFMSNWRNLNVRGIIALAIVTIALISLIAFAAHVIIYKSKESSPKPAPITPATTPAIAAANRYFEKTCIGQENAVITQHNDNNRSGANLNEVILNTSNVNPNRFGKLFTRRVDGQIYAQPLYLCNVNISGVHNVIYVATMHNTVYAFDADDPNSSRPLWIAHLGSSIPLPDPNICPHVNFVDITIEVGIVITPYVST